jgi:hypothetical protein
MPGPGAAAGAKAAGSTAGRVTGGAASRSGSAKAAKSGGSAAASRSSAGKGGSGGRRGGGGPSVGGGGGSAGGGGGGQSGSPGRFFSFRAPRRDENEDSSLFGSTATKLIALAGGTMLLFLVVIIAPLVVLQANASGCGEEEGDPDKAVPIHTNHQTEPENLSETQVAIRIYLVGVVMHMTPRQIVGAYATGYVETGMRNLHWATEESRGVFMQRPLSPWIDNERNRLNVIDASIAFFLVMRELDHGQPIGELDAEVQKPLEKYEYRYATRVAESVDLYNRIHRLVGTAAGIKSLKELDGVTIGGSGLDSLALGSACSGFSATGPANLKEAKTLYHPRSFKTLPEKFWAGEGEVEQVDTRIWPDAVWVLTNYHLKVTAARETGHETHGDGTAMDMVPADGDSQEDWDNSALKLARDLGWTSGCGENGLTRSAGGLCDLVPAIRFIGYNGYSSHGDPAHCPRPGCPPHIHVSWESNCYGCYPQVLGPPATWVKVFPVGPEVEAEEKPSAKPKKEDSPKGVKS